MYLCLLNNTIRNSCCDTIHDSFVHDLLALQRGTRSTTRDSLYHEGLVLQRGTRSTTSDSLYNEWLVLPRGTRSTTRDSLYNEGDSYASASEFLEILSKCFLDTLIYRDVYFDIQWCILWYTGMYTLIYRDVFIWFVWIFNHSIKCKMSEKSDRMKIVSRSYNM